MNGSLESIKTIVDGLNNAQLDPKVGMYFKYLISFNYIVMLTLFAEVVISPPAPYLLWAKEHLKAPTVSVAAQNAFNKASGAFTGEISVEQIKDVGSKWVILGHSERRTIIKESDEFIADKTKFALDNGLGVILCIGETLEERNADETISVVNRQVDAVIEKVQDWSNVVIAYEPVWAIGTGLAATPDDAQNVHKKIREHLAEKLGEETAEKIRIIYGGSANGKNAPTFKDKVDVDGFLVGGASLKPEFVDIINSRQ